MTKDSPMPTRRILLTLLAAATAALTLTPPTAQAGTETVYTCRNADGTPGTDVDWKLISLDNAASLGTVASTRGCAAGGPLLARLDGPSFAAQEGVAWRFALERPLTLVGLQSLDRETLGLGRGPNFADRIWYIGNKDDGTYLDQCLPAYPDASGANCAPTYNIARSTRSSFPSFGEPDTGWVGYLGCVGNAPNSACQTPSGVPPQLRIYSAQFLVNDSTDPSVTRVSGSLAEDGTVRGRSDLTLGAADSGSGVYQVVLKAGGQVVDTQVADANGGACADNKPGNADPYEFGQAVPCRLSISRSLTFDTTRLPEGPVPIQVVVRDATGNESVAVNRTVVVDNVPAPRVVDAPHLNGTALVGRSLVADAGRWDGSGRPVSFSYRWLRCTADGTGCQPVDGRTGAGYDLEQADAGRTLVAEVTAVSDQGATTVRTAPSPLVGGGSDGRGAFNGDNASDQVRLTAAFTSTRRTSVTGSYGRRFGVTGTLQGADGSPVRGALIDVGTRASNPGARLLARAQVRTDATGVWRLKAAPGASSRTLRFAYRSRLGDSRPAAEAKLTVRVRAAATLKITPRRTGNHGTIRFTGRLRGGPVPGRGKLVELQARGKGAGRWLTFRTLRTDRRGIFASRYRFHATYGPVTYEFRVRVRAESAYPYLTGLSRRVSVRVG